MLILLVFYYKGHLSYIMYSIGTTNKSAKKLKYFSPAYLYILHSIRCVRVYILLLCIGHHLCCTSNVAGKSHNQKSMFHCDSSMLFDELLFLLDIQECIYIVVLHFHPPHIFGQLHNELSCMDLQEPIILLVKSSKMSITFCNTSNFVLLVYRAVHLLHFCR